MKELIGLVHYDEVTNFFERLAYIDKLNAGDLRCHTCNAVITLENFKGIFKKDGELYFMCREMECCKISTQTEINEN